VRLLALSAGRALPSGRFLVLISVRDWVNTRAIVRLKRLGKLKKIQLPSGLFQSIVYTTTLPPDLETCVGEGKSSLGNNTRFQHPAVCACLTFGITSSICMQLRFLFTLLLFIANIRYIFLPNWPTGQVEYKFAIKKRRININRSWTETEKCLLKVRSLRNSRIN
jgi:hypothetical protein